MSDQDARLAQLAAERHTTAADLADHERGCIGCDVCRDLEPELENDQMHGWVLVPTIWYGQWSYVGSRLADEHRWVLRARSSYQLTTP